MSPVLAFALFALCTVALAGKNNVEPEYLDMLLATGQDEEFGKLLGIDVSLVRPQEGRSEDDIMFNTVSALGDILLSSEQEEQARQGVRFDKYPASKWPNNTIPYTIAAFSYTFSQRDRIEKAIAALNGRTKTLKVVPRKNNENDYVYVFSGNGCYSNLGRIGGVQRLSLQSTGCLSSGTIQHEFIHAAGFTHEHNRPDRDDSVRVIWENISPEWRSQYEKVSEEDFGNQATYDHYSVMHYPLNAPNSDKPAFEIYDTSVDTSRLGQRDGPTPKDIQKIDELYP